MSLAMWFALGGDASLIVGVVSVRVVTHAARLWNSLDRDKIRQEIRDEKERKDKNF